MVVSTGTDVVILVAAVVLLLVDCVEELLALPCAVPVLEKLSWLDEPLSEMFTDRKMMK